MPDFKPQSIYIYAAAVTAILLYDASVEVRRSRRRRRTAENHKKFFQDKENLSPVPESAADYAFLLKHTPTVFYCRN